MKNISPLVSVLMTTYNRAQYIEEAIESVIASTYKNWELIIVDDCSTDNTEHLIQKYLVDTRIQYHKNEKNLGQFPNRNKAASLANGKYIKYLDSDDIIYKNSLEIMVEAMKKYPEAGLGIPHTDYLTKNPYPFLLSSEQALKEHFSGKNFLAYGPSASIFRKKDLIDVGGFDLEFGILTDTHLTLKLASAAPVVFTQRDLIYWRIHEGQVTEGQKEIVKMIILRHKITMNILNHKVCPLSQKQKKEFIDVYSKIRTRHFIKLFLKGNIKGALKIRKETKLNLKDLITSVWPNKFLRHFKKTNE